MAKTFNITFEGTSIQTLDSNDVFIPFTGAVNILNTFNRIAEKKLITWDFDTAQTVYSAEENLAGKTIYISPGMFVQKGFLPSFYGSKPNEYWYYSIDPSATPGTYDMIQNVNISYAEGLTKNFEFQITIIDDTNFSILMKSYLLYDLKNFMNSTLEQNKFKLLKDRANNATILDVSNSSVYNNANFVPQLYVYIEDSLNTLDYSFIQSQISDFKAGFYGKNEHETSPYFTNQQWTLSSATTSGIIALNEDTLVTFKVSAPLPTGAATKIVSWLIRVDTNDDSVDFIENYDASIITTDTIVGGTDNKIIAPSDPITYAVGPTGNVATISFTIDKNTVAYGQCYRLIAVCYDEPTGFGASIPCNSFISDQYCLLDLPRFTQNSEGGPYFWDLNCGIYDYRQSFGGNDLTCIVEERLRSQFDFSSNNPDNLKDTILQRLGLVIPDNDIRRFLTKIVVEVYEDVDSSTRHYFDRQIITRVDPITYNIPESLEITGDMSISNFAVEYNYRVRYESNVKNIETTYNGIPLLTPTANQNWAGRDLRVRLKIELFYPDYYVPFTDTIIYIQKLHPKTYDFVNLEIVKSDYSQINPTDFFCSDEQTCLKAIINSAPYSGNEYELITTIEESPGSINTIEENETYNYGILPKLTSDKFSSQERFFSETEPDEAQFCLENSNFKLNKIYKLSAIAKNKTLQP